ncbi:TPA: hypothetical protein QCH64_003588 [Enterobacter asburiae]|uniref:hypothetical protein n=1 Tax=Enterobacter asburiae TaxID=61645 RepID=UPI001A215E42|nr:hypothetical protein [Enterobacter asburiae]MCS0625344.1 hypothetical protein [Enterobacter asburiae]MDE7599679.1 hypothetical protein [Enterobacter asburiae]HAT7488681.1 hypothetical protein [Enterobacter asburiae]HAT7510241.1 hypothetical protein [Enterobacter asburiae]HDR2365265.1 hypothetical protein [Enterobacter asburiae]
MKYYKLEITDKDGNTPLDGAGNPIGPFDSSLTPGSALHIEFDALITGYDVVSSGTNIAIYGVPVTMLRESTQLAGCQIDLTAGFTVGLPLANPGQAGLILSGQIYNPYANWLGTHQSLNFIVNPSPLLNDKGQAASITLDGKKGENLKDVLTRALTAAYPGFTLDISISDQLVLAEDGVGVYTRLTQLAATLRSQSFSILNRDDYTGVQMVMQNKTIRVFDNTQAAGGGIQILPSELAGQPTWIGPVSVSFKCPMRADLRCGDTVKLPENIISGPGALLAVNNERSYSSLREQVNFSGNFLITSVRHVGDFLNPDNDNSWVTIYEAVALAKNTT